MRLFEDKSLTKEAKTVDFGIVLAGDTKRVTYYLFNETSAEAVEIKPTADNPEVSIISCPTTLKSKEVDSITLEQKASVSIRKGLKTSLNFKFFESYS